MIQKRILIVYLYVCISTSKCRIRLQLGRNHQQGMSLRCKYDCHISLYYPYLVICWNKTNVKITSSSYNLLTLSTELNLYRKWFANLRRASKEYMISICTN